MLQAFQGQGSRLETCACGYLPNYALYRAQAAEKEARASASAGSSWREKSCTCLLSGPQNQASATVAVGKLLQRNGQGLLARQACAAAAARVDALRLLQVDGRKRRHRWIGKLFPIEGSALKAAA